ncbi:ISAzo13 family transposase [Micromonosporaceae bacterium Da 78-11]
MTLESALAEKFEALRPLLDERQWRLLLGAEARALGHGGIAVVTRASGVARSTVSIGLREVRAGVVPDGWVRAPGGGRRSVGQAQPGLEQALEALVAPATRGDPMSLLRWTTKSLRALVKGLSAADYTASQRTVARLLRRAGYRLQVVFKTKEGAQHPDRDAQFGHIDASACEFLDAGDPVVSLDCKKKELVGEYANKGREYQPQGSPVRVNGHDFPAGVPKAIPYGVYDIGADEGWVSVGVDHETSAFAVNTLRTWWNAMGKARYPKARRLMLTADGGGSNGYRRRAFKVGLAAFAAETGLDVTVCHFPPGTSKWNKIEHKMFSFISINWRGRPLTDYQTILELIGHTTTETGLTVSACLDDGVYPTGVKVTDDELAAVPLVPQSFHGEWNYTIGCGRTRKPARTNKSKIK